MNRWLAFDFLLLIWSPLLAAEADLALAGIPEGYHLQAYDDCGVIGRQPDVRSEGRYLFPPDAVQADERARSVSVGAPDFDVVFDQLAGDVPYVLAITYASEKGNRRVQSLSAGSISLYGKHVLPDGKAERLFFKLPAQAIEKGKLTLRVTLNEGPNAVVSEVGLWAPLPSPEKLNLEVIPLLSGKVRGIASDLAYNGLPGVSIEITDPEGSVIDRGAAGPAITGTNGAFEVDLSTYLKSRAEGKIRVWARQNGLEARQMVSLSDLSGQFPSFVPIPARMGRLRISEIKLDGRWRIQPAPPTDFQNQAEADRKWADFTVPGQFLQQGFNVPRDQPVGVVTHFTVPGGWSGCRVFLRFEAVHGGAEYWLNGRHLGYSESLFTPVEFDVTDAVRFGGRNYLALTIKVQTVSESLSFSSDYAFHNLGGIDRSVRLFAAPPAHLAGFHHETLLDSRYRDAILKLACSLENSAPGAAAGLSVEVSLTSLEGHRVALPSNEFPVPTIAPGRTNFSWDIPVSRPLLWSAEKPFLYKLTARLRQNNALLEELEQKVGFRKIELREHQLWINGQRVKLAGACRHEVDPLSGRAATAVHAVDDVRLFREANLNYVRTSHYPPTREFLEACDRLGLYVDVEAPFCWVRGRGEDDLRQTRHFLIPAAAMLDYNRDHPCVIIWSLANESGSGPGGPNRLPENFSAMLELCHRQDNSRPVIFNNEWNQDSGETDLSCLHYPPLPIEDYAYVKNDPRPRPVLVDEYTLPQTFLFAEELKINPGLDVVCWSGQNTDQSVWSQFYHSSQVIGGDIWAGIDEEFFFRDGQVKGYGPWGFVDVWRRPKSLLWDCQCIYSPVWVPISSLDFAPSQTTVPVPIENRYSFTDLRELRVVAEIGGRKIHCPASLAPQSKGVINVPVPGGTTNGSLLVLRFYGQRKNLIVARALRLGRTPPAPQVPRPRAGCPSWTQNEKDVLVRGNQFELAIDRLSAAIVPDRRRNLALLGLPKLHVTRREEKNPFNPNGLPFARYPEDGTRVIDSIAAEQRADGLAIALRDHYKDFRGGVTLLLDAEGSALVSFDYTYLGTAFSVSEAGLRWNLDQKCQEIAWRRQSDWEVYPENHLGRAEGRAQARPPGQWSKAPFPPYLAPPAWPWHLDANEMGTRDFRATKYHIYEAALLTANGAGLRVYSDGSANVRASLAKDAVQFHLLLGAPPAQLAPSNHLSGSFAVCLVEKKTVR